MTNSAANLRPAWAREGLEDCRMIRTTRLPLLLLYAGVAAKTAVLAVWHLSHNATFLSIAMGWILPLSGLLSECSISFGTLIGSPRVAVRCWCMKWPS